MISIQHLWLIPAFPLLAAAVIALTPARRRAFAAFLAIGSMALSAIFSCAALVQVIQTWRAGGLLQATFKFRWLQLGQEWLELGWTLDPLSAVMLVMVSFVGLLIFVYSTGYMAEDRNYTRFFGFLSLFAAAMLGLVISNNLLLLFMCWELVGLTSYLLIGFWYDRPSASAAAKKAFLVTRVGDLAFLLGLVWLYAESGTLLLYDGGRGCVESPALASLAGGGTAIGLSVASAIGLLIFCGAVGKSGQVPLHVWLPDAMEGPTPVSALIHAATMVAAGVFLVGRMYPLMAALSPGQIGPSAALVAVTWVGAITALFAASIALAQSDIKRILAYSTVSQLGFMMVGLGTGGLAVGIFHLIAHAFFKALLFMGAGSVIHGCSHEQDIRRMGGLSNYMRLTFLTYTIGMLALSGFPLLFSGFWSKDAILHAAHGWPVSHLPFYLVLAAAFLTAFYMARQWSYVFLGKTRPASEVAAGQHHHSTHPHESPTVMLAPLVVLAFLAIAFGFLGTPAWPAFQAFIEGRPARWTWAQLWAAESLTIMAFSSGVALTGLFLGGWLYRPKAILKGEFLQRRRPDIFTLLEKKFYVDEAYEWSFVRLNAWWARASNWLDSMVADLGAQLVGYAMIGLSWCARLLDEHVVNRGFDESCRSVAGGGAWLSCLQNGQVQRYLRVLGLSVAVLVLLLLWGVGR